MKRFNAILLALLLLVAVSACGGGSSDITPAPDGNNDTNSPQNGLLQVQAPTEVIGNRGASVVPNRLNVLTSADEAKLQGIVGKYGINVLYKNGNYATVEVPAGSDLSEMASMLEKEFIVTSAEPINVISSPRAIYDSEALRSASFSPLDPFYNDVFFALDVDGDGPFYNNFNGQNNTLGFMGFPGAWDVSLQNDVATQPVTIAIIDAGWFDYSVVNRPGLDETSLDAANSGFVADDGTFTAGLAAATWDLDDDADPAARDFPFRDMGERMLGIIAAGINDFTPQAVDTQDPQGTLDEADIWNEGIAGVNPNATFILIKTGELNVDTWTFSDNHIAESIDHAVGAGANIILLGMSGQSAVGGNVSTVIQNARDNDVLVIAPAGDVVSSFNGAGFDDSPIDIGVTPVTPGSDANCLSVGATGFNRLGTLPDVDITPAGPGPEDVPNVGRGWFPGGYAPPFDAPRTTIANYSNTGADIAAPGMAVTWSWHPFLVNGAGTGGDPEIAIPGIRYTTLNIAVFSSAHAAAYVAGAASQVFQTLSFVNGSTPTDDEVLAEILDAVQFAPLAGTDNGGILNANLATVSAINGGGLNNTLPALSFDSVTFSQPFGAITRNTDLDVTVSVVDGTAPFELEIDWGNGDSPTVVSPWTNGDPVTLTGGYGTLGPKIVNITVRDDESREVSTGINDMTGVTPFVINPLSAGITVEDATTGAAVVPGALLDQVTYRFRANASNVYTGSIGGTPNTTTFEWDFNEDGTPDATGPTAEFTYLVVSPTGFDVELTITEDVRPGGTFTIPVTVSPNV